MFLPKTIFSLFCFLQISFFLPAQTIICNNYNVPCTHPEPLNAFYGTRVEAAFLTENLPFILQDGINELRFQMPCGIIQDMNIHLALEHDDASNLEVGLQIENLNPFVNNLPNTMLLDLIQNNSCPDNSAINMDVVFDNDDTVLETFQSACQNNNGMLNGTYRAFGDLELLNGWSRGHFADEWILRVVNNGGSGTISAASIDFTFGFVEPYTVLDSSNIQSVDLINELVAETFCDQSNGLGATIERVWQVTFEDGETETCNQIVGLLAPKLDELILPEDTTVNCENIEDFNFAFATPPSFGCHTFTENLHDLCDISYTYEDSIVFIPTGERYFRLWTALNWCSGNIIQYTQQIDVECSAFQISGRINSYNDFLPTNVEVFLEGNHPQETIVDSLFQFDVVPAEGSVTIFPQKNDEVTNGISTYDLVQISKHILGSEIFQNPYRIIAADVNLDGNVSTLDLVNLRHLILFVIDELPGGASWRFVPANYNFPNPQNPFESGFPESIAIDELMENLEEQNFIAIKIGDVN